MTKFVGLRAKTLFSYLNQKEIGTKMCITKGKHKGENKKNCLEATQLDDKINYLEKKNKTNL